jgi:hypothetical protein
VTLLQQYKDGTITRHELLVRLCQAATDQPPEELAVILPPALLAEVREWSAVPPDNPDKCRVIQAGGFTGRVEYWAQHFQEESRRLYDGLWRWHGYFLDAKRIVAPDRPGD